MNLLEKIKKTLSLEDAKKAAIDHKEAVSMFLLDMKEERILLTFNQDMEKQINKRKK